MGFLSGPSIAYFDISHLRFGTLVSVKQDSARGELSIKYIQSKPGFGSTLEVNNVPLNGVIRNVPIYDKRVPYDHALVVWIGEHNQAPFVDDYIGDTGKLKQQVVELEKKIKELRIEAAFNAQENRETARGRSVQLAGELKNVDKILESTKKDFGGYPYPPKRR